MAKPNETLEHIASFLADRASNAARTLEQVEKVRREQGENAVQLIVSHSRYSKSLKVTYSVDELHRELKISKPTLYRILTPKNGDVLAEYGITMRSVGKIQKWTYNGDLLTNVVKAATGLDIPQYPSNGNGAKRPAVMKVTESTEPSIIPDLLKPERNGRGEAIIGRYWLSEVEVGMLRWLHRTASASGEADPRVAYLIAVGLATGLYTLNEGEGKSEEIAALKAEIKEEFSDTKYDIDPDEMYPVDLS